MPIYEYICQDCSHEFEHLVRGSETPACPSCGKERLAKKFSVPAAHTGSSEPACPAKEAGICGTSACGGNRCGLSALGMD